MPIALIVIGLLLVVTGARDTYGDFAKTVAGDAREFLPRAGAIGMIGAIGFIGPDWRRLSTALLVLWTLAMLLGPDKDVFNLLKQEFNAPPVHPTSNPAPAPQPTATPTSSPTSSPLGLGLGLLKTAASILAI